MLRRALAACPALQPLVFLRPHCATRSLAVRAALPIPLIIRGRGARRHSPRSSALSRRRWLPRVSLQQMAMDGARPGPWLPRYIFDDDATESTVEMPPLPEVLTDNTPSVSLADAVFGQTTVPTWNKELKTKTRIGIPDQDWHARPGLASPTRIPPSNSRQLNAWLHTLNDTDFAEAMNSPSHDFTAECHPYEAAVLRNAKKIKWKRSLPSPASTPSQATAGSDGEAAYVVSFSGRGADAAFCSQLNNHM